MELLNRLNIKAINPGAFSGYGWISEQGSSLLSSYNPHNGSKLGEVATCSMADYQCVMERAVRAAADWRRVPAPKRGEIIRQIGQALREHKDSLGSLVSLEMGKSKQEGDGEVQEMIDIADFAVGVGADYAKFGAPARGERVAKYNRLLSIEVELLQHPA